MHQQHRRKSTNVCGKGKKCFPELWTSTGLQPCHITKGKRISWQIKLLQLLFFFTIIQNLSCTYENNKHNTIFLIYFLVIPCGLQDLVPSPGIDLAAMTVKALSPNHWATGSPHNAIFILILPCPTKVRVQEKR